MVIGSNLRVLDENRLYQSMYFQPYRDGVVGRGVSLGHSSSWFKKIEDFETSRFRVELFSSFGFYVRIE